MIDNSLIFLDNLNIPIYTFQQRNETIIDLKEVKNNFENERIEDYEYEKKSNSTNLEYLNEYDENNSIISNNNFIDDNLKCNSYKEENDEILNALFFNEKENSNSLDIKNIKTTFNDYLIKITNKKSIIKLKKINKIEEKTDKVNVSNNEFIYKKIKKIKNFWNKKQKSLFQIFKYQRKNKNQKKSVKKFKLFNKTYNIRKKAN